MEDFTHVLFEIVIIQVADDTMVPSESKGRGIQEQYLAVGTSEKPDRP